MGAWNRTIRTNVRVFAKRRLGGSKWHSRFHLDSSKQKKQKQSFPSRNTSRRLEQGWDALHCHLVSMVTCCYGNKGRRRGKGGWGQEWAMEIKRKNRETGRGNHNEGAVKLKWRESRETPVSFTTSSRRPHALRDPLCCVNRRGGGSLINVWINKRQKEGQISLACVSQVHWPRTHAPGKHIT